MLLSVVESEVLLQPGNKLADALVAANAVEQRSRRRSPAIIRSAAIAGTLLTLVCFVLWHETWLVGLGMFIATRLALLLAYRHLHRRWHKNKATLNIMLSRAEDGGVAAVIDNDVAFEHLAGRLVTTYTICLRTLLRDHPAADDIGRVVLEYLHECRAAKAYPGRWDRLKGIPLPQIAVLTELAWSALREIMHIVSAHPIDADTALRLRTTR